MNAKEAGLGARAALDYSPHTKTSCLLFTNSWLHHAYYPVAREIDAYFRKLALLRFPLTLHTYGTSAQ